MHWEKINEILKDEPAYRQRQVRELIYKNLISNWSEASSLPATIRDKLATLAPLDQPHKLFTSGDTERVVLTLEDGLKIETVLMRYHGRNTVCVSSQVGCSLGCYFCATGKLGFKRNLTADEIVGQVLFFARRLKIQDERVGNVVFMGMGEPFLNFEAVMAAIKIINDQKGLSIGARHIAVSTVGLVEGIKKFTEADTAVNLAISLHAPNDHLRRELMPIAGHYPITKIIKSVEKYISKTGRKVMFEYLMIDGLNDTDECAKELVELMRQPLFMLNLIPYNSTGGFKASSPERIKSFKNFLMTRGINVTERQRFGRDITAACGQLAGKD